MRMSPLMVAVVRADAAYFIKQGHEAREVAERLEHWLNGNSDREIEAKVTAWMELDLAWIKEVFPEIKKRYWYLWPVVPLALRSIEQRLTYWLEALRQKNKR